MKTPKQIAAEVTQALPGSYRDCDVHAMITRGVEADRAQWFDTSSSASVQHFIDTGRYLLYGQASDIEVAHKLAYEQHELEVGIWPAHPDMAADVGPSAIVVQIDTGDATGRIRVNLNNGAIWDGDPDIDEVPGAFFTTDNGG